TIMPRAFVVTLCAAGLIGIAVPAMADEKRPEPLPADVGAAWKEAGADPGWMSIDKQGRFRFRPGEEGKAGEVAAFAWRYWKPGVLDKLPPPAQPFGLNLRIAKVTDAGLKELAGLKQLLMLCLGGTG